MLRPGFRLALAFAAALLPCSEVEAATGYTFETIALEGSPAPGTSDVFGDFLDVTLDESDRIAFGAPLASGFPNAGVWVDPGPGGPVLRTRNGHSPVLDTVNVRTALTVPSDCAGNVTSDDSTAIPRSAVLSSTDTLPVSEPATARSARLSPSKSPATTARAVSTANDVGAPKPPPSPPSITDTRSDDRPATAKSASPSPLTSLAAIDPTVKPAGSTVGVTAQIIHADGQGLIAELAFARGARIEPHTNPNTSWIIVIEGGGWVGVGDERTRVAAGEAVQWPPDTTIGAWTEHSEMRVIMVEIAADDETIVGGFLESHAADVVGRVVERGVGQLQEPVGRRRVADEGEPD